MRHRLDLINLQKPKIRRPPMRLEQRIVIRTEMSRRAPTVNGGVEHSAEAGAIDHAAVDAESDDATRELVHDHEHPVALEHDGLTAKEVDAPETVGRVSDERQPGRAASTRCRPIVFRQDAMHDVLVELDPERLGHDARNPRTPEARITGLELHDGSDERLARSLRAGLPRSVARGEQAAVLAMHQGPMEGEEGRRAHADGDLPDPLRTEKQGPDCTQETIADRQVRRPLAWPAQHDQLLLEQEVLSDHGPHAAGSTKLRGRDCQVEQSEQVIFHRRQRRVG